MRTGFQGLEMQYQLSMDNNGYYSSTQSIHFPRNPLMKALVFFFVPCFPRLQSRLCGNCYLTDCYPRILYGPNVDSRFTLPPVYFDRLILVVSIGVSFFGLSLGVRQTMEYQVPHVPKWGAPTWLSGIIILPRKRY